MQLNEIVLKDLFSHPPTRENLRFVFLVESEALEDQILTAGYMAVGIADENQRSTFLQVLEACQFSWMKDFYFIPSSKFGLLGEVKKEMERMGFTVLSTGWKIFHQKEDYFKLNPKELAPALSTYIASVKRQAGGQSEPQKTGMVCMADVEEKAVDWLVLDYLPKGQIIIMAGDGGSGKTSAWCEIAASISSGRPCFLVNNMIPEGFEAEEPKKVMFFSAEDSLEHVLKARLRKSGAIEENILTIGISDDRFADVKFDSPYLEQLIAAHRPALVIFDPIQAFLPPNLEMSKRNSMRNCLRPLIGYGEKYGCTFLIVVHTNKQSGLWGRKRIADSADIWDIARSVFLVGETKEKNIRYISHEKCNYGMTAQTVLFSNATGKVEFKGYTDKKDKDFITEMNFATRQAPQREEAKEFILETLKEHDGEMLVAELNEIAEVVGLNPKAMERAKTSLRKEEKINFWSTGKGHDKKHYIISMQHVQSL